MKLPERLRKSLESVRDLLARMTRAQRLSLALLVGVMLVALGVALSTTPTGARMVPYDRASPELIKLLDENDFQHEVDARGRLLVRADQLGVIAGRFVASGNDERNSDFMDWVHKELGFNQTAGLTNLRLGDSQRRKLELMISQIPGTTGAHVVVNKKEHPFRVSQDNASTASVQLVLAADVPSLKQRTARTAARMVAGALGIPIARVVVTDNRGNDYPMDGEGAAGSEEKQLREREMVEKLARLFDGEYDREEIRIEAEVLVNRSTEQQESTEFDADASVNAPKRRVEEKSIGIAPASYRAPGTATNVSGFGNAGTTGSSGESRYERTEEEISNNVGEKRTRRSTPAGQEERWSLVVELSKPAVVRVLKHSKEVINQEWNPSAEELEKAIEQYLDEKRRRIQDLPNTPTKATVSCFVPVPRDQIAAADSGPGGFFALVPLHLREVVLTALALLACVLLYRVARGGTREAEEMPDPVEELSRFLRERDEKERRASAATAAGSKEKSPEPIIQWQPKPEDQRDMQLLEEITKYTKERPEIAAAVLRIWLNEEQAAAAGGAAAEESVEEETGTRS